MAENAALMTADQQAAIVEQVVMQGDLAKLTPAQRVQYYRAVCQSVGVNPLTKPFDYLNLNGKLVLYATRTCTDQIRANTKQSVQIAAREVFEDVYVVTARGTMPDGRTDESTGAVNIAGLKGEAKANAYMKAETKAKRRLTLSMAGLGWMDESEVSSVPTAHVAHVDMETGEILAPVAPVAAPKPATPTKTHPLVGAGLSPDTINAMAAWIGGGRPGAQWSADQKTVAKSLSDALLAAAQAGIAAEELTDILIGYMRLEGDPLAHAHACRVQVDSLRRSLAASIVEDRDAPDALPDPLPF